MSAKSPNSSDSPFSRYERTRLRLSCLTIGRKHSTKPCRAPYLPTFKPPSRRSSPHFSGHSAIASKAAVLICAGYFECTCRVFAKTGGSCNPDNRSRPYGSKKRNRWIIRFIFRSMEKQSHDVDVSAEGNSTYLVGSSDPVRFPLTSNCSTKTFTPSGTGPQPTSHTGGGQHSGRFPDSRFR